MIAVSVIIPVYNGEGYLEECLNSVLEQDIEEKEIICVDDGSEDNSLEIINKFMKRNGNIVLLRQENQGAAAARNRALDVAKGDYVAFLDADDYYIDKTALRRMICECEKAGLSVCGSLHSVLRSGKMIQTDTHRKIFIQNPSPQIIHYMDFQYDYCYQSYLFKRELLNRNQIRFPDYRRYQDPPFMAEAMWQAEDFLVVPVELYCYRVRSMTMKYSFVQINDLLRGILHNVKFAKGKGLFILLDNNIKRLNNDFYYAIKDTIKEGNLTAVRYLIEIEETLKNITTENIMSILILENIKTRLQDSQRLDCWDYRFPYESVPCGSKVAVYGAGTVGRCIVRQMEITKYCSVVVWVDKKWDFYQKEGSWVERPEILEETHFDYLLAAVENENVFQEIREEILKNHWSSEPVIIGPMKREIIV